MKDKQLVTIAVTTYQAASTIKETLESILLQTYQPLELIISDDCSTDDTLAIVKNWLGNLANTECFARTELLTVPENTGVSANCNRCIKAAEGEWVKFIAGDDILLPNCIEDNMTFVAENPSASIVFSKVKIYKHNFEDQNFWRITPLKYPAYLMGAEVSAQDQHETLLLGDRIHYTPSYFFKKEALLSVDGYDESNSLVEDYPMWLKLTKSGYKLYFHESITVGYRMHDRALNNQLQEYIFKPLLLKGYTIREREAHPHLPWEIVAMERVQYTVRKYFQGWGWNKPSAFYATLYRLLTVYLNPFQYVYAIKKRWGANRESRFYQ